METRKKNLYVETVDSTGMMAQLNWMIGWLARWSVDQTASQPASQSGMASWSTSQFEYVQRLEG